MTFFGGSGASRMVTVTPAADQNGATLTPTVTDAGSLTANDTFILTVGDTTAPTVTSIARRPAATAQLTNSASATLGVAFSEAANEPATANLSIARVGNSVAGTVDTVTSVGGSRSIYDVAGNITSGTGEIRLKIFD